MGKKGVTIAIDHAAIEPEVQSLCAMPLFADLFFVNFACFCRCKAQAISFRPEVL
jgi:hypothetical protein